MFAHYDCIVVASVLHVDIPYCSDYKDACCEHPSLMFMVITVKIGFISSRLIENNYFFPIISTQIVGLPYATFCSISNNLCFSRQL